MSDVKPNADARHRIDAHLDAVERRLMATGMPRGRRRGIVDDLEAQVTDMLAGAGAAGPNVADVDRVLSRLDPPEVYGEATGWVTGRATSRGAAQGGHDHAVPVMCPEVWRAGKWLAAGSAAGLVLLFCLPVLDSPDVRFPIRVFYSLLAFVLAPTALAGLTCGTVAGWTAVGRIRRAAGTLRGTGPAVAAAVFAPVLALWVVALFAWLTLGLLVHRAHWQVTDETFATLIAAWILTSGSASWASVRRVLRFARSTPVGLRAACPNAATV